MASPSLEELLAEEGFRGRKSKPNSRSSFKLEAMSMPLYLFKDQIEKGSSSSVGRRTRTERARSDVSGYKVTDESPKTERVRSRKHRDDWIKSKKNVRETAECEIVEETDPDVNARLPVDLFGDGKGRGGSKSGQEENERFKDIYSNEAEENERGVNKDSDVLGGKEKDKFNSSFMRRLSFSNNSGKTLRRSESSGSKYNGNLHNQKSFKVFQSKKHLGAEAPVPEPALDEVAIQAVVSIISGYIRRFPKDKEFRESLRDNCSSCLSSMRIEEDHKTDGKVLDNLEEAIELVEQAAQESRNAKELKKASLQLSVITSLNSKDLKDGFTSGIPNSLLSACAHLYLSVIYKMQKKDRISAKHLLQVFCDSPSQARKSLLPELWDFVFLPHLSHLRAWYDQEAASIRDTSSRPRKLKVLEKVYDEILDSGTYQFAVYYKDWLTEGTEAPALPSISIPSTSVQGFLKGDSVEHSLDLPIPADPISSQSMISKKLYDAVFINSNNQESFGELDEGNEEENHENGNSSFDASSEEDKKMVTYSLKQGSSTSLTFQEDVNESTTADIPMVTHSPKQGSSTSLPFQQDVSESTTVDMLSHAYGLLTTAEEGSRLPIINTSREEELKDKIENSNFFPAVQGNMHMLQVLPHNKANELILRKLAESFFINLQAENSNDFSAVISTSHFTERPMHDSCSNLISTNPFVEVQGDMQTMDVLVKNHSFPIFPRILSVP